MKIESQKSCEISENLKKGTTEMLVLAVLSKCDTHIYSIVNQLDGLSGGECKITFPYAAIYRLMNKGYIVEIGKRIDDNRLRQFYHITDEGREYLRIMKKEYDAYTNGVAALFAALSEKKGD